MHLLPLLFLLACSAEAPPDPVKVKWISVFASDYDLELEPDFDAAVIEYTALADAPGIVVQAEIFFSGGDAEAVTVNAVDAAPSGFRTWLSDANAEHTAPAQLNVEIDLPDGKSARYIIDVTVP